MAVHSPRQTANSRSPKRSPAQKAGVTSAQPTWMAASQIFTFFPGQLQQPAVYRLRLDGRLETGLGAVAVVLHDMEVQVF